MHRFVSILFTLVFVLVCSGCVPKDGAKPSVAKAAPDTKSEPMSKELQETIRIAEENNDPNAQLLVGIAYQLGALVEKDDARAAYWYTKASNNGNSTAQNQLALMYLNGEGVAEDDMEAFRLFKLAAANGNDKAQLYYAVMLENGYGGSVDAYQVIKWLQLSAEQDNPTAQERLGIMLYIGEAKVRNFPLAHKWLVAAYDNSNSNWASHYLGEMSLNGDGVRQNSKMAALRFSRAAENGFALSQLALAKLYAAGEGVAKDPVQAYRWYGLAIRFGKDLLESERQQAIAGFTETGPNLSGAEIEASHQWIENWQIPQ